MYSVLANATPEDVVMTPFPHLVLRDAIDPELCARLVREAPPLGAFTHRSDFWLDEAPDGDGGLPDNLRVNIKLKHLHREADASPVSALWRDFALAHASSDFFADVVRVMGGAIDAVYPRLAERFGRLGDMRVGRHGVDRFDEADILLGASITANTPVTGESSRLRGPHVDQPDELYNSLLYLRDPEDASTGGELELYRFTGRKSFRATEIDDARVEKFATVPYESNLLVMFVNSLDSLHGVSPRGPTPYPRRMFLAMGYVEDALFDLAAHQA